MGALLACMDAELSWRIVRCGGAARMAQCASPIAPTRPPRAPLAHGKTTAGRRAHCFRLIRAMDCATRACERALRARLVGAISEAHCAVRLHGGRSVRRSCAGNLAHCAGSLPAKSPRSCKGCPIGSLSGKLARRQLDADSGNGAMRLLRPTRYASARSKGCSTDQLTSAAASWRRLWRMRSI
jgi:hypothetical protein